jgi:heme A synthase
MAIIVAIVLLTTAVKLWRHTRGQGGAHILTQALPFFLVVQVVLGILSVTSVLGLWQVTAHLGCGVLLLQTSWLLTLSTKVQPVLAQAPAPVLTPLQVPE